MKYLRARGNRFLVYFLVVSLMISTVYYAPILPVHAASFEYNLFGAFAETGVRDGAINCTLYRTDESQEIFLVDGWNNLTETASQIAFKFDLGYNETRTYYLLPDENETIYVVKPAEPYYTYYFTVVDFLGVDDAFLETLLNINGTDIVLERWKADVLTDIPFTLTWGTAYKLRIVCDRGTYYYPEFVAGATTSITVSITSDMFPIEQTDISKLTISIGRTNSTWLTATYTDSGGDTTWIYMGVYLKGDSTILSSTNVTASSLTWNWYGAESTSDYYVRIQVLHDPRGNLTWVKMLPHIDDNTNPFLDLDDIMAQGGFPIAPSQFIGMAILMFEVAVFSQATAGIGLVVIVITAMILNWLGFVSFGWTWLTTCLAIAILIAFSIHKDKETML